MIPAQSDTLNEPWSSADDHAVSLIRGLALDAVEAAGNGHPGTAVSLAPAAYLLFRDFVRHDPADPEWRGRDRFVLSAGHTSLTLYSQLLLSGMELELSDFEQFRSWGSRTPGHPEYGELAGVETTTGPLGQGFATAVGMAMAQRYQRGLFDPKTPAGQSPFDYRVWVIASDGDLQEGISAEAASLAGRQALSTLCVLWDDNQISIEGDTNLATHDDVTARFESSGWQVLSVPRHPSGDIDLDILREALSAATFHQDAPTFIRLQTTIAWPAPTAQGTAKSHGSALGADEVAATKSLLGLDPNASFQFPDELLQKIRNARREKGARERARWDKSLTEWRRRESDHAKLFDRLGSQILPPTLDDIAPPYRSGDVIATRQASGEAINALAEALPELWGGSADLAESNNTTIKGAKSFLPEETNTSSPYGRNVHFGIREHAMGAIVNGIAVDGLSRPFGATFLTFSDYMRGAVRLAALMQVPSTFIWTHDSIGLGEDGPTHQPVEQLWALRAIPQFAVCRPADGSETFAAWLAVLSRRQPVGLVLSRQGVPTIDVPWDTVKAGVARGGYLVRHFADASALILATGSEVNVGLRASDLLISEGIRANVASLPCLEWFDEQDAEYRNTIVDPAISVRVAVEAGSSQGWHRYVGDHGRIVGLDRFGASAPGPQLFEEFGITGEHVAASVREALQ